MPRGEVRAVGVTHGGAAGGGPRLESLPSPALARRLAELCSDARNLQVDFLLHLSEFDARRDFAGAGYPSLWAYCTEVLRLREGATWRRIEAMKLLRRFPALEAPLRDGRLCLTTLGLLGPVLAEENVDELVGRAAFLSKVETERLVASMRPRGVPAEGLRRVAARGEPQTLSLATSPSPSAGSTVPDGRVPAPAGSLEPRSIRASTPITTASPVSTAPALAPRTELRPVAGDTWSLRVTLGEAARAELLELAALTSHATHGDLAAVLRDAVRCALAKARKRRGSARSERKRRADPANPRRGQVVQPTEVSSERLPPGANGPGAAPAGAAAPLRAAAGGAGAAQACEPARGSMIPAAQGTKRPDPRAIPLAVRQAVWERDGGRCAWVSPDGKRCGSTWKLQLGHVRPVALGGEARVEDLRVECITHNQYEAVRVLGRRHMARFLPSLGFRRRT